MDSDSTANAFPLVPLISASSPTLYTFESSHPLCVGFDSQIQQDSFTTDTTSPDRNIFLPVSNQSFPSTGTSSRSLQLPVSSIFESSHLIWPTKQSQPSYFSDIKFFFDELAPNGTEPLASELGDWNTIATEGLWPSCPMTEAFDGGILNARPGGLSQNQGSSDFQMNTALHDHAEEITDLSTTPVHESYYDDLRPSC
jgi:hypothetical protein